MKRLRAALSVGCLGALAACSSGHATTPPPDDDAGCPGPAFDGGPLDPTLASQGQALVSQYQCQQCHGQTLSGNDDGVILPNGTVQYPPNLTNDPATGLGCWTDDQIENAILNGFDNQDNAICAPMPHFSALGLTQADAQAIAEFLRSQPVYSNNPPSGPDCSCAMSSQCPGTETCLDAGFCTCESLACAIPGLGDAGQSEGGGDGGTDGGMEHGRDGGFGRDGGYEPDAGLADAGPDAGASDAGPDAGPDAGIADAGLGDGGAIDAGAPDAGPVDAGWVDAGAAEDGGDGG